MSNVKQKRTKQNIKQALECVGCFFTNVQMCQI